MATQNTNDRRSPDVGPTRNPDAVYWIVVLLWAGLVFTLDALGAMPRVASADAWTWVFFGAGVFGLLGAYARASSTSLPNPTWWDYAWSIFLTLVGLGGFFGIDLFWPLVLIIAALALVAKTFLKPERGNRQAE